MVQKIAKFVLILTLIVTIIIQAHSTVTPTLALRSQGFHGDRQRNVGMVGHINLYEMESWCGTFDIGVGYSHSFDSEKLAHCLLGDDLICNSDCKNTIKVQGSSVASRDAKAWLADYLYLNCDYDGCFSIKPLIQNVVIDLDFYLGLDEWVNGMYFRIYGPINWTKWQTRFCVSDPATVTTTSCSTGYLTPSGSETLLSSMANYFNGDAPVSVDGITFQGLKYAKMPACDETKIGFADLRVELGWNFFQDNDYHIGAGLHVAAPTGNKRRAEFVMQPVVGNGNHWELGGTIHGHYVFWRSDNEEQHFGLYFDAVLTHLFSAKEQRTFDLVGKCNSRYMLASKFGANTNKLICTPLTEGGALIEAPSQFDNVYAPVANLTTIDVNVSAGIHADIVAMFNYTIGGFAWDLGYNFWGRTCESFKYPTNNNSCKSDSIFDLKNQNKWGLKGDARMFGFAFETLGNITLDEPFPLSATQKDATIHTGTNATTVDTTLSSVTLQNGGVDDAHFAGVIGSAGAVGLDYAPTTEGGVKSLIKTSIQPIFIKSTDVALHETKGLSHTIFTHLSYTWDRDNWIPYLGVSGSAEFGKSNCDTCSSSSTSCSASFLRSNCSNCCTYCSLSQWSVWVKGGLSFN